jgi:hypothetical protein
MICEECFTRNSSLIDHLKNKRCKVDFVLLHEKIKELTEKISSIVINGDNNNTNNNTNIENVIINFHVNDISSLDTSYIKPEKMKELVNKFNDFNMNLLISEYIKNILCNKEHPENHAVKYVKRKPQTYSSLVKDTDGNLINVIKNLSDSCALLEAPILETLKEKLTEYIKDFKEDPKYDRKKAFGIWEELKKGAVYNAVSSVLKNDVLNDLEMKIKLS